MEFWRVYRSYYKLYAVIASRFGFSAGDMEAESIYIKCVEELCEKWNTGRGGMAKPSSYIGQVIKRELTRLYNVRQKEKAKMYSISAIEEKGKQF